MSNVRVVDINLSLSGQMEVTFANLKNQFALAKDKYSTHWEQLRQTGLVDVTTQRDMIL